MHEFAELMSEKCGHAVCDVSHGRYKSFKVGPVFIVNHGMGAPSISILLNELVLALTLAKRDPKDITMFRMGTCGGLGVPPGTVVVTSEALNEHLEPYHEVVVMGETVRYPTHGSHSLVDELKLYKDVVVGKTMSANCFYENQGRIESAYSDNISEDEKMAFLNKLYDKGVRNIEMEGVAFSALARRAHIRAAVVCVVLVDRLHMDAVGKVKLDDRPLEVVSDYIRKQMILHGSIIHRPESNKTIAKL
mmetsp:Transcript_12902/g.23252  ORF Transcript_12902/g.23252 Transcript_12902/m.23252 type:complete len:248 (+) Transcript_12902:602-1345(+)